MECFLIIIASAVLLLVKLLAQSQEHEVELAWLRTLCLPNLAAFMIGVLFVFLALLLALLPKQCLQCMLVFTGTMVELISGRLLHKIPGYLFLGFALTIWLEGAYKHDLLGLCR